MKLFNSLKNKKEFKKVSLTYEIDINDSVFNDVKNIKKINVGEIVSKYGYNSLTDDKNVKIDNIITEIINSDTELIIGYAFYELKDLTRLIKKLINTNSEINKIFIPSEKRLKKELEDGQKLYREHNRWIDFYPGQIEQVNESKSNKCKEIESYFSDSNIDVVKI